MPRINIDEYVSVSVREFLGACDDDDKIEIKEALANTKLEVKEDKNASENQKKMNSIAESWYKLTIEEETVINKIASRFYF